MLLQSGVAQEFYQQSSSESLVITHLPWVAWISISLTIAHRCVRTLFEFVSTTNSDGRTFTTTTSVKNMFTLPQNIFLFFFYTHPLSTALSTYPLDKYNETSSTWYWPTFVSLVVIECEMSVFSFRLNVIAFEKLLKPTRMSKFITAPPFCAKPVLDGWN